MPNHWSAIGFQLYEGPDIAPLALLAMDEGIATPHRDNRYLHWQGAGAELWVVLDAEDTVLCMNPHYAGSALMHVKLDHVVERPDEGHVDGGFYAFATQPADRGVGEFPFVFDSPCFELESAIELPAQRYVQLAAFADSLEIYPNSDVYYTVQRAQFSRSGRSMAFAVESFISTGLFGANRSAPTPRARFSGEVLSIEKPVNPYTNRSFYALTVRTLGGELSVVVDPEMATAPITQGSIISGQFWLSGLIVPE